MFASLLIASLMTGVGPVQQTWHGGYLLEPQKKTGRGVLVLHPWWGLNSDVKAFCRRLAKSGFTAYAPDLFHGETATTEKDAEALANKYSPDSVGAQVDEAANLLSKKTGGKIAVIGFSYGAYCALHVSNSQPSIIKGVVVYYGTGESDFSKSKSSYLGHFAEKDKFEDNQSIKRMETALKKYDRPVTVYTYPGTGHWFAEPSVKSAYQRKAAEMAWKRTIVYLKLTLAPVN